MLSITNLLKGNNSSNTNFNENKYGINKYKPKEQCKNPKISIIVPVYNAKKYIERCIHHLVLQTLEEIEIIVVDDGSTDNCIESISKLAETDKRIIILKQSNQLQGAARNNGLKIAKGEYIGFCDADDFLDLNYYEFLYNTAKAHNADIALAENIRISQTKYKKRLEIYDEKEYVDILDKFEVCNQNRNECPTNKIYKRDLFQKYDLNFTEGVYCEDKLFSLKAVYYANKIVTVPDVHYFYWENPISTVNTRKTRKHKQDRIKAKKAVLKFVKEKNIPVKNWYFKAEKYRISFLSLPLIIVKESTESERYYLFGIIPLLEKKIKK